MMGAYLSVVAMFATAMFVASAANLVLVVTG